MFRDQLAVADDRQLIAFLETIAVSFDKGDLGAVNALLFDSGQKCVLRALIFLHELVPCCDFLVETSDVFERIVSRYDFVENT